MTKDAAEVMAVLSSDVLARIDRASKAAAGTSRLSRYGYAAEDVAAEVVAEVFAEYVSGRMPNVSAVEIGKRARRVAERVKRGAMREIPADIAAEMTAEDKATADTETARRSAAAVLSRKARRGAPKRTDVLAVADDSRQSMRAAEDSYLTAERMRRLSAAMDREWLPSRAAEIDAWLMLAELAESETVPSHGIGDAADIHTAENGERTEPMHGPYVKDTSGRVVGRTRVFVVAPSVAVPSRAERAELRAAERAAVAEYEAAVARWSAVLGIADMAEDAAEDSAERVAVSEAAERVSVARAERDAAVLARDRATRRTDIPWLPRPTVADTERAAVARRVWSRTVANAAETRPTDLLTMAVAVHAMAVAKREYEAAVRYAAPSAGTAEVVAVWHAATVTAESVAETSADILGRGYLPETLAERVSASRAAKASHGKGFNPAPLMSGTAEENAAVRLANLTGRNWLWKDKRRVRWTAVLPGSTTSARAALGRAAKGFGSAALGTVAESFDRDAATAVHKYLDSSAVTYWLDDHSAVYAACMAVAERGRVRVPFKTRPHAHGHNETVTANTETDTDRAERMAMADAYGYGNGEPFRADAWLARVKYEAAVNKYAARKNLTDYEVR